MSMICCNLCSMEFDENDPYILIRKDRHEEFHAKARIQKRNTTNGDVLWHSKDYGVALGEGFKSHRHD